MIKLAKMGILKTIISLNEEGIWDRNYQLFPIWETSNKIIYESPWEKYSQHHNPNCKRVDLDVFFDWWGEEHLTYRSNASHWRDRWRNIFSHFIETNEQFTTESLAQGCGIPTASTSGRRIIAGYVSNLVKKGIVEKRDGAYRLKATCVDP